MSRLNDLLHESEGRLVRDRIYVLATSNKGETDTENKFHPNVDAVKSQGRVYHPHQVTDVTDHVRDYRFKVHV